MTTDPQPSSSTAATAGTDAPMPTPGTSTVPTKKKLTAGPFVLGFLMLLASLAALGSLFLNWYQIAGETLTGMSPTTEGTGRVGDLALYLGIAAVVGSLLYMIIPVRVLRILLAIGGVLGGLSIAGLGAYWLTELDRVAPAAREVGAATKTGPGLYVLIGAGAALALFSLIAIFLRTRKETPVGH